MVIRVTINGFVYHIPSDITIMEACERTGWPLPHLCFLKDINEIGACRVCVVEVEGEERLITACNNKVYPGMVIYTNSPRVQEARRINLQLILSQHDSHCTTCSRNGNCALQRACFDLGIEESLYKKEVPENRWPQKFPLIREESKCIKCLRCVQICDKVQSLGVWDLVRSGGRTTVSVSGGRHIENADCTVCGQCVTHCPTGALHGRQDRKRVYPWEKAINNPETVTVVQVAPAVRAAWGEGLNLSRERATPGRLAAALRRCGFNFVFDTNFGADLTVMEEASEFLKRMTDGKKHRYPMFTSCCPGWVRFMKSQYPDMVDDLSTSKSPQGMQATMTKTYFAEKIGVTADKIFSISIMPCLAKKAEIEIPNLNDAGAGRDLDVSLTTREMIAMIRAQNLDVDNLPEEPFDSPLGVSTGAGVIFGTTGGVMEAALRTGYYLAAGENPNPDAFKTVLNTGTHPWSEAAYDFAGIPVRTAVVSGLANTRKLIRALRRGEVHYDFVEVMACPGGCVGGGGQPIHDGEELAALRGRRLHNLDRMANIRFSHENPEIQRLYRDFLGEPLSEKAERYLHTDHHQWQMPLSPHLDEDVEVEPEA